MQEYLDFAIEIAKYAGVVIKDNFLNDNNSIEYKEDRTPVTIADKCIFLCSIRFHHIRRSFSL